MERATKYNYDIRDHQRKILLAAGAIIGTLAGLSIHPQLTHFKPRILCTSRPIATDQPVYLVELDSGTRQWRSLPSYIPTPTPGGKSCDAVLRR